MRLTYFDDAGLFNAQQEPFIVAAGVMIDADNQMIEVEHHLEALRAKWLPEADRDGFIFHATNIWSGTGYFRKNKDDWPLQRRLELLADLAEIPAKFDLVVVWGHQDRAFIPRFGLPEAMPSHAQELAVYTIVVMRLCDDVEDFMKSAFPDEITILIAEDRDSVRAVLKDMHRKYRRPDAQEVFGKLKNFPFHHIRDTIHFAKKAESAHLQIADACTFILKKRLEENDHIRPFYAALKPQLSFPLNTEDMSVASW